MVRFGSLGVRRGVAAAMTACLVALGGVDAAASSPDAGSPVGTVRVSVNSGGVQGNGASPGLVPPAISADGRYVAFDSDASNLVAGDTNGFTDVFVRDRATGVTERVSVGADGVQGNSGSYYSAFSADGRHVAFASDASNLVRRDTNNRSDVFVHDRSTGVTRRVSVGKGGVQANDVSFEPVMSADGRYVAFESTASNLVAGDSNEYFDVFVRDRWAGVTRRVSVGEGGVPGNGASVFPAISADGRYVVFASLASNLVAGDTNGYQDVFVRDQVTGVTRRMSVGAGGAQGNADSSGEAISADGRYVAYTSEASNLVAGDTNRRSDVFVRDRFAGITRRVSVGPGGAQAQGNDVSGVASLSTHGRYVAFTSSSWNLVAGDTNGYEDVFIRDRVAKVTRRVSIGSGGAQSNNPSLSWSSALSAHGRYVAFSSDASNLVAGDTNNARDVFVGTRW